jgi:hypothetical protein
MERIGHGNCSPVIIAKAGIGATNPDEIIEAAEEAVVWLILFSRGPQGGVFVVHSIVFQKTKPNKAAEMDILKLQPIFNPVYTLHGVSNAPSKMPVQMARRVS